MKKFEAGDAVSVCRLGQSTKGTITGFFDYPATGGYPNGTTDYSVALVSGDLVWVHESRLTLA